MRAVLTGDIVNSTAIPGALASALIKDLETDFAGHRFEFYRGDAFQLFMPDASEALKMVLISRCRAIAISEEMKPAIGCDIRIGLGLGEVEMPVEKLGIARGEAFLLSGRSFDELADTGDRLSIAVHGKWPALSARILGNEINGIFSALTSRQAEVLIGLLQGKTQRDTAQLLNKSQSTIHQHLVSARWPEIESCLGHYREIIKLLNEPSAANQ